jgi:hypothetical protein
MSLYYGQMYFDADGQGWSEGYYLLNNSLAGAKTDMATLIAGRQAFIYLGYAINYARVSDLSVLRDAYIIGSGAVPGLLTTGKVNRVADCMLVRGQHPSPPGGHNNFFWHGVPDESIVDGSYFPTGNAPYDTALAAYLVLVKSLCGWATKKKRQGQITTITGYDSVALRNITSRKVGRPFGMEVGRRRRRR